MRIQRMFYFVSVCEYGGLRDAAEKLGISQSTLSIAIRHLEGEFETRLFNRKHRKMILTDAGEYYLKECKSLLEEYGEIPGSVRQIVDDKAFEISFSPALGTQMAHMVHVLDDWSSLKKQVIFQESKMFPDLKKMIQGYPNLYFWYTVSPLDQKEDGVCRQILCKDEWAVIMSHSHPYVQKIIDAGGAISLEDLKKIPRQSLAIYTGEQELFCTANTLLPETKKIVCDQLHTLFAFLACHQLITILPCSVVWLEPQICCFPLLNVEPVYIAVAYSSAGLDITLRDEILALLKKGFSIL